MSCQEKCCVYGFLCIEHPEGTKETTNSWEEVRRNFFRRVPDLIFKGYPLQNLIQSEQGRNTDHPCYNSDSKVISPTTQLFPIH